ncbi:unnamed protein product, partial [Prorocentrum cordatum]
APRWLHGPTAAQGAAGRAAPAPSQERQQPHPCAAAPGGGSPRGGAGASAAAPLPVPHRSWPREARAAALEGLLESLGDRAGGDLGILAAAAGCCSAPPFGGGGPAGAPSSGAPAGAHDAREVLDDLEDVPEHFRCAIDGRLLLDPVRAPSGQVFERSVLARSLQAPPTLGLTAALPPRLEDCQRTPELRRQILQWVRDRRPPVAREA